MGWQGDPHAVHDDVPGEIAGITEKTTLHDNDIFVIEDSEASNIKKRFLAGNLPGGGGGGGGRTLVDSDDLAADGQINISTIPGTHNELILLIWGRTDSATVGDGIEIQVGNAGIDTGSNYSWYYRERGQANSEAHAGDDTSISTEGGTPAGSPFTGDNADAGHYGFVAIRFPRYADTDFHRFVTYRGFRRGTSTNIRSIEGDGVWQNAAAAITDIKVTPRGGTNFKAGSAWELYGID